MIRRGKLICSVSEEVPNIIEAKLASMGLSQSEAFMLSRKYKNIKTAINFSSLNPIQPIQIEEEEEKAVPVNVEPELTPAKRLIKEKLIEIGASDDQIALLVEICENADEAIANILGDPSQNFFQPRQQEEEGEYEYNRENKEGADRCSICYESYVLKEKIKTLPCTHNYHKTCINDWFHKGRKTCPVCLTKVKYK